MKAYRRVDVYIHIFLTSSLAGGERSDSRPCRFTPGVRATGIHWIGGWVGPRAGLDEVEKRKILDPTGTLTPTPRFRLARSQSLYRLRYPSSLLPSGSEINFSFGFHGDDKGQTASTAPFRLITQWICRATLSS
jgi:hypothetical protein